MRTSWCRGELRSTRSRSRSERLLATVLVCTSVCVGLSRVQCSVPPRTMTSCCANNQSAAGLSPPFCGVQSSPATRQCPLAICRTSSSGLSSTSCSSFKLRTECTLIAIITLGRRNAVRPSGSSSSMLRNSNEGAQPVDSAEISPTLTGTPMVCWAKRSSAGRYSPIRGTIQKCKAAQAMPNKTPSTKRAQATARIKRDSTRVRRGKVGKEGTNI